MLRYIERKPDIEFGLFYIVKCFICIVIKTMDKPASIHILYSLYNVRKLIKLILIA